MFSIGLSLPLWKGHSNHHQPHRLRTTGLEAKGCLTPLEYMSRVLGSENLHASSTTYVFWLWESYSFQFLTPHSKGRDPSISSHRRCEHEDAICKMLYARCYMPRIHAVLSIHIGHPLCLKVSSHTYPQSRLTIAQPSYFLFLLNCSAVVPGDLKSLCLHMTCLGHIQSFLF